MRKQKSFHPKEKDIQPKWVVVDAKDQVLGRVASYVASILMGKTKAVFTPSAPMGDFVVVLNTSQIKVTGKKLTDKTYYWFTGYPGGLKSISLKDQLKKDSTKVLEDAIKGMLPKTKMGRFLLKRVKLYSGAEHQHAAQTPELLAIPAKEI